MKKVLFIASLNTKKEHFDGERIKSTFMFETLKKVADVKVINLSRFKLFNTSRIVLNAIFCKKKYDNLLISKDPHGANIIMKILRMFHYPLDKIAYFEIGPFLYDRILNGSIKKETFFDIDIVVETNSMKEELQSLGFSKLDVFPNFKPIVDVPFKTMEYPKQTLKLVYFSRISEMKGIYDLICALAKINDRDIKFSLDIFGRFETKEDEFKIRDYLYDFNYIKYCGKIDVSNENGYKTLSEYDLHVFPTKYSEGFPGTIIDFFIAGVPTLSSTFTRAKDILTNNDSLFYELGNQKDLIDKLDFIYSNQNVLISKRKCSFSRRNEFSIERFEKYIKALLYK